MDKYVKKERADEMKIQMKRVQVRMQTRRVRLRAREKNYGKGEYNSICPPRLG